MGALVMFDLQDLDAAVSYHPGAPTLQASSMNTADERLRFCVEVVTGAANQPNPIFDDLLDHIEAGCFAASYALWWEDFDSHPEEWCTDDQAFRIIAGTSGDPVVPPLRDGIPPIARGVLFGGSTRSSRIRSSRLKTSPGADCSPTATALTPGAKRRRPWHIQLGDGSPMRYSGCQ